MQINEIFVSLNGESVLSGLRTIFIRTYSCPLRCSYCDTKYSWEGNEFEIMPVPEIMDKIKDLNCKRVTLTGGEPLIQQDAPELIRALLNEGYHVEIETNGAVDLEPFVLEFDDEDKLTYTMDWKCPSSGENGRMIHKNLDLLGFDDVIKFVVGSEPDLDEMRYISEKTNAQTFVSPVFGSIELKDIANYILDHEMNSARLQIQLHKIVWPVDMRGV